MRHIILTIICLFMLGCLGRGERINIEYEQDRRYDQPRREKRVEHHHHHYKKPHHRKPRCQPKTTHYYNRYGHVIGYSQRDSRCNVEYHKVIPRHKTHHKHKPQRHHKKKHHRHYD